ALPCLSRAHHSGLGCLVHHSKIWPPMTVVGQSRSFGDVASMSELPSRAVVERTSVHGRKVPTADIPRLTRSAHRRWRAGSEDFAIRRRVTAALCAMGPIF